MKRAKAKRRLTSNLWVWKPNILSRFRSFHHIKETKANNKRGHATDTALAFKFIQIITFLIVEKRDMETSKGHRETCTGKKGDRNIRLNKKNY